MGASSAFPGAAPIDDWADWVRLTETPGVGREAARRLLAAFGSPRAVLQAGSAARRQVVAPSIAEALDALSDELAALLVTTRRWLAAASAEAPRQIVTLGDPHYPAALLQTADPPLMFYAEGRIELLAAPCVAIVGSRQATAPGLANARAFARALSEAGMTVVSGLAQGIDGAAHEGALQGPAGTIAVVGTGLDQVFPKRHAALAARIGVEGLMLSEYALGMPPLPHNFPQRNRIIAGLSRGTLVVEAALQSGSLISARLASEAGREVFAIPGSIHSPQSRGCHGLIKQGAKLVESAADVLEEIQFPQRAAAVADTEVGAHADDAVEDAVLAALGFEPTNLDALVARTGWSAQQLNIRLLELELEGRVNRLPGQLFQRVSTS
ncbi:MULTISPECIES: DNA-processing protein DprA [unclassified Rhizobacter]|uniref:DNA-processing protein DprA n=1 Tax=unclassified Rhizobacter TaxID=2640088 RepID=UPI0006F4E322|nr:MULTISPECIES: DNA-processing protein DprA [unclassified Rhizobacter]KQU67814.1 DNA processing protein DprA [Rhizobacter sp. Root29]KQW15299.1 DNA processing protein DprA [Rhizobacter sp. Root1238]KRB24463.1 DNA processing protein DprA [Rhizobacter sp. Root16D2]